MMVIKMEIWPGDDGTRLGVPAIDAVVTVEQHPRSDGSWALVKRVLDQL